MQIAGEVSESSEIEEGQRNIAVIRAYHKNNLNTEDVRYVIPESRHDLAYRTVLLNKKLNAPCLRFFGFDCRTICPFICGARCPFVCPFGSPFFPFFARPFIWTAMFGCRPDGDRAYPGLESYSNRLRELAKEVSSFDRTASKLYRGQYCSC